MIHFINKLDNVSTHGQLAELIAGLKPSGLIDGSTVASLNCIMKRDRDIYFLFVERLKSDVISSISAYLKSNIFEIKETFKGHDRLQEKLDSSATKYAALKAKDNSITDVTNDILISLGRSRIVNSAKGIRRNVYRSGN